MKNCFRLVFSVAVLVMVSVAALLQPEWASDLSLNGWNVEELLFPGQHQDEEVTKFNTFIM